MAQLQSMQDVEQLVKTLYSAGLPQQQLYTTQKQLHELQLSDMGWDIGNGLLSNSDANVRFFGAVTFYNKLNTQDHHFSPEHAQSLHQSLINWVSHYATAGNDMRVVRKLATALALFYLTSFDGLDTTVSYLIFNSVGIDPSTISETVNLRSIDVNILQNLPKNVLLMVLWVINGICEEGNKRNSSLTPPQFAKLNQYFSRTMLDINYLIEFLLTGLNGNRSPEEVLECRSTAMSALSAVKFFYLNVCNTQEDIVDGIKRCLTFAIAWVNSSRNPDAIKELNELLTNDRIFDANHYAEIENILTGWGKDKLREEIVNPDEYDDEDGQILSLLISYTDSRLANLLEEAAITDEPDRIRSHNARVIIDMMQELLQIPGYPEVDEQVASRALEFWNQLIEYVEELIAEEEEDTAQIIQLGKSHTLRVIQQLRIKVKSPTTQQWHNDLDHDQQQAFREFRLDCRDTIQSSYRILGTPLFQHFSELAIQFLSQQNWLELETALYCLMSISPTEEANDEMLVNMFKTVLNSLMTIEGVEQRTLRTATDLVGVSTAFFRRNLEILPLALNFLFSCLQSNSNPEDAARAINHLCDTCRGQLVSELPSVFQQYEIFLGKPTATQFAIEKLSGAVSFLLQTLPNLADTLSGVSKLLEYVGQGIGQAKQLVESGQIEEGHQMARFSLNCLSSIANSLRAPSDIPVEIDATATPISESTLDQLRSFQSKVFQIIAIVLSVLSDDGEIIAEVCNVFKAGFTESSDFAFHFTPDIVYQFFGITNVGTTNIEAVLRMICSFLRSQERTAGPPDAAISRIIQHFASLIQYLESPSKDSDVTHGLMEVLERTVPHWIGFLLQLQPSSQVEQILGFSIATLEISEPLPKRSAINFWVSLTSFSIFNT
jgi:hypothetical protein